MQRRNLLFTLCGIAGAGGILGTGAFTSVSGRRSVRVSVADDNDAYLGLSQLGAGERSGEDGTPGRVQFSFPGDQELSSNPNLGLGPDSVYEFDRDAGAKGGGSSTEGLLRIANQGTQSVEVYSEHETDSDLEVELYDVTDADRTALRDDPVVLDVGEEIDVGFRIRTFDSSLGTFDETLTIVADATDD